MGALGGLASIGCEAQVGPEYVGDVTLELRGHVVAPPGDTKDLVPALVFQSQLHGQSSASARFDIIDGMIEGIFPSDFELRVAEPPRLVPEDGGLALGYVGLVPRDHPASVDLAAMDEVVTPISFDPDGVSFKEHRETCIGSDKCRSRDYACVTQACDTIDEQGDPEAANANGTFGESETICVDDACYQTTETCRSESSCFRRTLRCDITAPGAEP
ncbi:MAG TPA: hypothetical protein VEQ59_08005, partial [Polyangiaceae bacterium]|nr:hypothetical protein [Polyangiaceae bacterium]